MTESRYLIPQGLHSQELEIKHSQFICHIHHTTDKESVKTFLQQIKTQYPDATHHCWAFQNGPPGDSREIGYSDDGEPHGTAGKPILNVISHADIGELMAIVTRYYGGTKLGTGGLSRAYAEVVKLTLESLPVQTKVNYLPYRLSTTYQYWPQIELILKKAQAHNIETNFSENITSQFELDQSLVQEFEIQFINITHGSGILNPVK